MEQKNEFNSFSAIQFAWKWRKTLLIVALAAGVLTFVVTSFIKPTFRSTTIIYAPMQNSFLKNDLDVKKYGHEHETEQLIQTLNSRDFKDTIIRHFDLITYYEIDTTKINWRSAAYKKLEGNLNIKRTQYGSIVISVEDKCPYHAAQLANAMVDELDVFKNRVDQERAKAAYELLQRQVNEVHERMVRINDSVQKLANEGLFIFDLQVDRVIQQYATTLGQGNMAGAHRLQKEIERLIKWGPTCVITREELIFLVRHESHLKTLLWEVEMNLLGLMPTKFVVEKAIPIEKKVFPKKTVISLFSALSAFIVTFFALLIMENVKTGIPLKKDE